MMWIFFSLLVAFFNAARGVATKQTLKKFDKYVVSWAMHLVSGLLILSLFFFIDFPALQDDFWSVFIADCALSAVATILSVKAILRSDISLVMPMTAFTPIFMIFTSFLMLGEFPSFNGLIGIILIVIGAYCLNINEKKKGWIAPLRALMREEGPRLMLAAALIWSITGNMDKIAIEASSSIFFAMAENIFISMLIFPFAYRKVAKQGEGIIKERKGLLTVGVLAALMYIFQTVAITQTLVVYVVAIKRLSILISIILGGLIFKEKNIEARLLGGVIMVFGVLFIMLL